MRNPLEYPITKDEMIWAIQKKIDEIETFYKNAAPGKISCGDITGWALQEAKDFIEAHYDEITGKMVS